ncbi:hypothetical protein BBK36DRAFT_1130052 [Trichoderma citrinoviride]|uniref:NACHT domain-containing protein n=1 Tax=Trichoderma citrinoviride TaxID=58853 RepID=A0A2T4AY75_9HYPO|nr:hypothetical protein BBK36DRAFT_1130052 [Trichoderma citrinoviride]PTB62032.1 hypothetical protein BBK36DRAFT_1130052 [Trichoderma citrinoviride]
MAQPLRGVRLKQVNSVDIGDDEPNVDIIAIHGLDTKSPDTWTWRAKDSNEPSVNWLSDPNMLPAKLKRVRIFTCDWPADLLQDSDSVPWTVGEFARRLLAGILDMRFSLAADAKGRDRPILFIASCLGGIILMKALVMADRPESDYYAIRKATRGIVFLATPFRGTSFQDIAAWVEPMLKTWASLRNRSVAQLLDSVKGSTYELEQLVRTFTRLCQDTDHPCKAHTFYETRMTILQSKVLPAALLLWLGQSKLLVDRSSATLDIDSDPLPLERRHVMMNKFCGPHDADYETVTGRLDALLQMVRNGPLQQADAWIRDKHYTADRLRIQRLSGQLLPMDQCYINLVIVERPGESTQKLKETQSSPFSVFARQMLEAPDDTSQIELSTIFNERKGRDGNPMQPRRILIRGRAGVGKTTLCKKIIHEFQRCTWTQWNKIFDRILWVPLRNLKLDERKRPGYNYECLFSDEYFSLPESKPKLARELAKALATKSSKTLFLLDGLDEVPQLMVGESPMALFLRDHLLKQPNVIITSRPSGKSLPGMDLELETIGFYEEQVEAYLNADPGIEPKINEVKVFLQQHWLLQGLVRIPVQLDALCYTWSDFDSGTSPETMTEIYQAIEQKLWRKDAVRLERMTQDEADSSHCTEIEDKVESEVHLLECLAFAGMHSDVLDYTSTHREKVCRAWRSSRKAHALVLPLDETLSRLSFLRSSDTSTRIKDRSYHFIHLTFQEYFAARYFVHQWSSREPLCALELGTQEKGSMKELDAESFLRREKYNARYDIFWRFVTGLLHAGKDEDELCRFFRLIEDQPRDLLGPVHQRLIMHCLSEVPSSDGIESFALLRKRLEHQLSQWLKFECKLASIDEGYLQLFGRQVHLVREVEFPEKCLNNILERASEDAKRAVLYGLETRPRLPRSTIDLMTSWIESEDIDSTWIHPVLRILSSHHDLPIRTLNALIRCIDDGNFRTQEYAVDALRAQGTLSEKIRDIIASRVKNGHPTFQRRALFTLSGLPLEYAIAITVAQLDHSDAVIRRHTLQSLLYDDDFPGYVIQAVAARLEDRHKNIRLDALSVLNDREALPQDAIKLVVAHLGDKDFFIQDSVLKVLRSQKTLPEDILKDLVAQLQVHDKGTQAAALKALNGTKQPYLSAEIVSEIAEKLQDRDAAVREQAALTLTGQSTLPQGVVKALAAQLEHDDEDVRLAAAKALCDRSLSEDILDAIAARLADPDGFVRRAALKALESKPDLPQRIVKAVLQSLSNEDRHTRQRAIHVLVNQASLIPEVLHKATICHTLLKQSFSEHISCYVMDGVTYLDMPHGLGKVTLKGNPNEFMEAMLEMQREVGIPRQIDGLGA